MVVAATASLHTGSRIAWRMCWIVLLASVVTLTSGCDKAKQQRAAAAANDQASAAIGQYSLDTKVINNAHRRVILAFSTANSSKNLPDYKTALRTEVLPAMDEFIGLLKNVPTRTPELTAIHGKLVVAYQKARTAIAEYEKTLETAADLPRFDPIRAELQAAVKVYDTELAAYYAKHSRQLLKEAPQDVTPTTAPAAATETQAPTAATPTGGP